MTDMARFTAILGTTLAINVNKHFLLEQPPKVENNHDNYTSMNLLRSQSLSFAHLVHISLITCEAMVAQW